MNDYEWRMKILNRILKKQGNNYTSVIIMNLFRKRPPPDRNICFISAFKSRKWKNIACFLSWFAWHQGWTSLGNSQNWNLSRVPHFSPLKSLDPGACFQPHHCLLIHVSHLLSLREQVYKWGRQQGQFLLTCLLCLGSTGGLDTAWV